MLRMWLADVVANDVDIFTGYNIDSFDFDHLINRCKKLHIPVNAISRLLAARVDYEESSFQSKAYGKRKQVSALHPPGSG